MAGRVGIPCPNLLSCHFDRRAHFGLGGLLWMACGAVNVGKSGDSRTTLIGMVEHVEL